VSDTSARREVSSAALCVVMVAVRVASAKGILGIVRCRKEGLVLGCSSRVRVRACVCRYVDRRALIWGMWSCRVS
jgi:hypothetical protein